MGFFFVSFLSFVPFVVNPSFRGIPEEHPLGISSFVICIQGVYQKTLDAPLGNRSEKRCRRDACAPSSPLPKHLGVLQSGPRVEHHRRLVRLDFARGEKLPKSGHEGSSLRSREYPLRSRQRDRPLEKLVIGYSDGRAA